MLHEALTVAIERVQRDLAAFPATIEVRRQILEATMKVLEKSVTRTRDSSRQPERSLAAAHMLMGDILLEQKNNEGAIRHYNQCHDILTLLYRANPANDKAALNYAASLSRQGDIAMDFRRDAAGALRLYREALAIDEHVLAHPPERPELTPAEVRRALAIAHHRIGEILLRSVSPGAGRSTGGFRKRPRPPGTGRPGRELRR